MVLCMLYTRKLTYVSLVCIDFKLKPSSCDKGLSSHGHDWKLPLFKTYFNYGSRFHVIPKNITRCNSWIYLYSRRELKDNNFESNENHTQTANRALEARVMLQSSLIKIQILKILKK